MSYDYDEGFSLPLFIFTPVDGERGTVINATPNLRLFDRIPAFSSPLLHAVIIAPVITILYTKPLPQNPISNPTSIFFLLHIPRSFLIADSKQWDLGFTDADDILGQNHSSTLRSRRLKTSRSGLTFLPVLPPQVATVLLMEGMM